MTDNLSTHQQLAFESNGNNTKELSFLPYNCTFFVNIRIDDVVEHRKYIGYEEDEVMQLKYKQSLKTIICKKTHKL